MPCQSRIYLIFLTVLNIAVCIAIGYWLDDREVGVRVHDVQTGSGVHPTSYPMDTGGSFPGLKQPGREADHSAPASAEVKKMWNYTYTPPYASMA
jgi:hypothetical protein